MGQGGGKGSMGEVWDLNRFKQVLGEPGDSKGDQEIQMGPGDPKRGSRVPIGSKRIHVSLMGPNESIIWQLFALRSQRNLLGPPATPWNPQGSLEVPQEPLDRQGFF